MGEAENVEALQEALASLMSGLQWDVPPQIQAFIQEMADNAEYEIALFCLMDAVLKEDVLLVPKDAEQMKVAAREMRFASSGDSFEASMLERFLQRFPD